MLEIYNKERKILLDGVDEVIEALESLIRIL